MAYLRRNNLDSKEDQDPYTDHFLHILVKGYKK